MFDNHTRQSIFDSLSEKYSDSILNKYPRLKLFHIHCYTCSEYLNTPNVPTLKNYQNTPFITICDDGHIDNDGKIFASIIICPEVLQQLNLSVKQTMATICHEIGHIAHYGNKALKDGWFKETRCDEVAISVGLASELASALQKLLDSPLSDYIPNKDVELRIKVLVPRDLV